jgi:hypothetical protein
MADLIPGKLGINAFQLKISAALRLHSHPPANLAESKAEQGRGDTIGLFIENNPSRN